MISAEPTALAERPVSSEDIDACTKILAAGSKSFSAAARVLPSRLRGPAAAVYAFCRVADDRVDEQGPEGAFEELTARLDRIYVGQGLDDVVDRAFSAVVRDYAIPRGVPDALLEGFLWDATGREYATIEALHGYGARVASTVGMMMTLVMGVRDPQALARAADLGVAMQLTNIARDVGTDAKLGRIYLPQEWLEQAGVSVESLRTDPKVSPALRTVVLRLLSEADRLYRRADAGIYELPWDCRLAIGSASAIYQDIGRIVARPDFDFVQQRAVTSSFAKIWRVFQATRFWIGAAPGLSEPPLEGTRFLVEFTAQATR